MTDTKTSEIDPKEIESAKRIETAATAYRNLTQDEKTKFVDMIITEAEVRKRRIIQYRLIIRDAILQKCEIEIVAPKDANEKDKQTFFEKRRDEIDYPVSDMIANTIKDDIIEHVAHRRWELTIIIKKRATKYFNAPKQPRIKTNQKRKELTVTVFNHLTK